MFCLSMSAIIGFAILSFKLISTQNSMTARLELCLTRHHRRFDTSNFDDALKVIIRVSVFLCLIQICLLEQQTYISDLFD